jgi:hypothetical protein
MGVASSEFWDIPTSVIANYCTNAIIIRLKKGTKAVVILGVIKDYFRLGRNAA